MVIVKLRDHTTNEMVTWRNVGDCFPESPEEEIDPPWSVDYDSGIRTNSLLQVLSGDESTQSARFICGHGRTRIWLDAWDTCDFIDVDDLQFLTLVTHAWRFTCDCIRECWADRRRGGKALSRRSLARARRWAAQFRSDDSFTWLRATWAERLSPSPTVWCQVAEPHPEPATATRRVPKTMKGARPQPEAA